MTRLYIGSLAYAVTNDSLKAAFEDFGTVTDASVATDRESGRSRGFGFVTFESEDEAKKACEEMNDKELEGRAIRVEISKPREERPQRREGGYERRDRGDRGDRSDRGDRRDNRRGGRDYRRDH